MAGNDYKLLEMAGYGRKWLEKALSCWKLSLIAFIVVVKVANSDSY